MKSVGFIEAIKLAFVHYADFKGRSRRSEYWWFVLFNTIVASVIGAIVPDFAWIWSLVVLVPGLALCIRRLHDVGKSGWFYLWILLPLVGGIILLIQLCKDSTEANQWAPIPRPDLNEKHRHPAVLFFVSAESRLPFSSACGIIVYIMFTIRS